MVSCSHFSLRVFNDFEAGGGDSGPLEVFFCFLEKWLVFIECFLCAQLRGKCLHVSFHLVLTFLSEVDTIDRIS